MKKKIISIMIIIILLLLSSISAFSYSENDYTIISPITTDEGISYSDNLLISVKIKEGTSLYITLFKYPRYRNYNSISEIPASAFSVKEHTGISDSIEKTKRISYYTNQIKDIEPGLYSLKIDKINSNNEITETYSKYFIVKPNSSKIATSIYQSKPSNKVKIFQSVFKNLFGQSKGNDYA